MEFLNYKLIKLKLKKRGILFKRPSLEDAPTQFYSLARQLDDFKLYSGFCHLAIANCQGKTGQVALLNAARLFSQAEDEIISLEDHIRTVCWIYSEALLICDTSFIRPIRLSMGCFHERHKMHHQAADCFKQSMSISRCANNLILSKRYDSALNELKNCPSHLMTTKDYTSMFLLELLLNKSSNELDISLISPEKSVYTGPIPIDDHLYDLHGYLESMRIFLQERSNQSQKLNQKMFNIIKVALEPYLDPAQVELLETLNARG